MASIVIVDDDELVAELAADALIGAGHACGWVTDAERALKLLSWRRPDLLLLDHDMPGTSGTALMRQLRSSQRFYDLPIMMFTRMSGETDKDQARFNGANDFISKPFDRKYLLWRVDRLLAARANRPRHLPLPQMLLDTEPDRPRIGFC